MSLNYYISKGFFPTPIVNFSNIGTDKYRMFNGAPLEKLVDYIDDGTLKTIDPSDYQKNIFFPKSDPKIKLVDYQKELKDICTDIVVKIFANTEDSLFEFLSIILKSYQKVIDSYIKKRGLNDKDIFIVYKGGNLMRFVWKEFIKEFPESLIKEFHDYYKDYFKRSDFDFSIYINPNLKNFQRIYDEMIILSYLTLRYIRINFLEVCDNYFDFCRYNDNYKYITLQKYEDVFTKANVFNDPDNKLYYKWKFEGLKFENVNFGQTFGKYQGRKDFAVYPDGVVNLSYFAINDYDSSYYISINDSLEFYNGKYFVKFALTRMKLNFNVFMKDDLGKKNVQKIGGEVIDVSIPHQKDEGVKKFYKDLSKNIKEYSITNKLNENLSLISYSLDYLIDDLYKIIFNGVDLPWNTIKYEKRINRIMYLYTIDIFDKISDNISRDLVMKSLYNYFSSGNMLEYDNIIKMYDFLRITDTVKMFNSLSQKNYTYSEKIELSNFQMVLKDNAKIMNELTERINKYIQTNGHFDISEVYKGDFDSIV